MARNIGLSEARRRLPALVRRVASEGGRIDISYRGKPQASLLRVSDVRGVSTALAGGGTLHPALRVELRVPGGDLLGAIRSIRGEQGEPRTVLLGAAAPAKKRQRARSRR